MNVIACIDLHAKACEIVRMTQPIIEEVEKFLTETGLSEHRVGFLLAKNGKLVERLRAGRRIWPETEKMIREGLVRERALRISDAANAQEDAA